ncbi:hypothetical protein KKB55_11555, partial [Myxococcota bacterium]|nr:hypothetical protein [Myxococcota bacterium]
MPEPDAIVVEPEPDATVVEPEPDATVVEPEPDAAVEPPAAVQFLARYDFEGDFEAEGVVRDLSEAGLNLVVQGVTTAEGLKGSGARFDGQSLLEAALNPLAGRTEVTVSLWFKTNNPENNFKLASAAWWNGGLNASGWNIGTHYPEIWADRQQEFWAPGERENHDNGFVP